jgi:hypothetical protein
MMPPAGTVNYVQGQVSVNGMPVTAADMGRIAIEPNDALTTGVGKAEVLLTPGVFLRVGNNANVRMISTDLAAPRVEIVSGEALIEVDRNIPGARVNVMERGADAAIVKAGLYRFDATTGNIAVYDGKLDVSFNGQSKGVGGGHQLALNNGPKLKTTDFDKKTQDELYAWSNVRSNYLAEANAATAQYIYEGYAPYSGLGWYWNPYYAMWSWLPGDGYFWSPFGYPFFSVAWAPYFGAFGHGWYGHGPVAGFAGHAGIGSAAIARSGGFAGAGLRGGGFAGGGFHGGFAGGGFLGGGGRR